MIDSNNIPWAAFELPQNLQHEQRIHLVPIACPFRVEVAAFTARMNEFRSFTVCTHQQSTTHVRIVRFRVVVDFAQQRRIYSNHSWALPFRSPPLNRIITDENSSRSKTMSKGTKVTHRSRVHPSATRVRIESEIGLPNGPFTSASTGKRARFSVSRPIPS